MRRRTKPARVLEVGAGTGAITYHIGRELGEGDTLDIFELQPRLANHLEEHVLNRSPLDAAYRDGHIRLFARNVRDIDPAESYDFIISGLPFNSLPLDELRGILETLQKVLRPGGVLSYFEYIALRRIKYAGTFGEARRHTRQVATLLNDHVERYQISRRSVLVNFPPAHARHWQFDHNDD